MWSKEHLWTTNSTELKSLSRDDFRIRPDTCCSYIELSAGVQYTHDRMQNCTQINLIQSLQSVLTSVDIGLCCHLTTAIRIILLKFFTSWAPCSVLSKTAYVYNILTYNTHNQSLLISYYSSFQQVQVLMWKHFIYTIDCLPKRTDVGPLIEFCDQNSNSGIYLWLDESNFFF